MMMVMNINHLLSKVVAEEQPGLGDEKINYQEYVVPAFLTQVGHGEVGADDDGVGHDDDDDDDTDEDIEAVDINSYDRSLNMSMMIDSTGYQLYLIPGDLFPGDGPHK